MRDLWSVIWTWAQATEGRSLVLTTHSMEEADTLCSRIGILVNGRLKCLGSSADLKSNHGQGYTVHIELRNEGAEAMVEKLVADMSGGEAEVEESFGLNLWYKWPSRLVLSEFFARMERAREERLVDAYSISSISLEQVRARRARRVRANDEGICPCNTRRCTRRYSSITRANKCKKRNNNQ